MYNLKNLFFYGQRIYALYVANSLELTEVSFVTSCRVDFYKYSVCSKDGYCQLSRADVVALHTILPMHKTQPASLLFLAQRHIYLLLQWGI